MNYFPGFVDVKPRKHVGFKLPSMDGDMMPGDEFVNQPEEQWTEAHVESDEDDAEVNG